MPKRIAGVLYLHKSAVGCLTGKNLERLSTTLDLVENYPWDIVAIHHRQVSFIQCPEFDTVPEPAAGERKCVSITTRKIVVRKESASNPLIFHRRYLFVDETYTGFDQQQDRERVRTWAALNPERNKMGRRIWWQTWCKKQGIFI